jgi:hypothetical protein
VATPPRRHALRTEAATADALLALGRAVEAWGGEWTARNDGGELRLPVRAGLRAGVIHGRADTSAVASDANELAIAVVSEEWELQRAAVALLVGAGIPALAVVLWPFVPALAPLVPAGLVLAAACWLAILARLRHHGIDELLAEVEAELAKRPRASSAK